MAVNWGLQGQGFDPLEALRYAGVQAQRRRQQQEDQRLEQERATQRQARQATAAQLAARDFSGATSTAIGAGDFDLVSKIGNLQEADRKKLQGEADILGRAAFGLKQLPLAQRIAQLPVLQQQLGQYGIEVDEDDLDDAALDGHIAMSQSIKDRLSGQLTQTRIADVGTDNARQDTLANNTITNTRTRLGFAANADRRGAAANARAAESRSEGRVRFRERDKDRAAVAAGGRGVRSDLSDLDY